MDDVVRGGDGRAYLIRSVNNKFAGISAFDNECMNTTGIISHGPTIEGQALMRSATDKALYVAGSHLTGWHPNAAVFGPASSAKINGAKWNAGSLYNPSGDPTTFNTQSSFIFPFVHKDGHVTYIWMADRWNEGIPHPLPGGLQNWTSVWLPLLPPTLANASANPSPGWEVRLEPCREGDMLQQFAFERNAVRHSSGLCVETPPRFGVSPLVLARCDGASAWQRWLRGANGSIANSTSSATVPPARECIAWNVFGDLLNPGDPVIAWRCLDKWDEQWDFPPGVTPGHITAMTSAGTPSQLCATVVSNTSGRWTLPWASSWSLRNY